MKKSDSGTATKQPSRLRELTDQLLQLETRLRSGGGRVALVFRAARCSSYGTKKSECTDRIRLHDGPPDRGEVMPDRLGALRAPLWIA